MTETFRVGLTRDFLREYGTAGWGNIWLHADDLREGITKIRDE